MSTVSSVSAYPTAPVTSAATGSSELNQDTFLKLLTTQLQNQDPTNPVSNEDFIAQLAQFSSLEQLQGVNGQLSNLNLVNTSMNNASMVNLLGQDVVAASDTVHYKGEGDLELPFIAGNEVSSGTITITDEKGQVVDTIELGAQDKGEHSVTWDGKGKDGKPVAEGDYTVTYNATDGNGNPVDITALIEGVIDELSFANGTPQPSINGVPIDVGNIIRLSTGTN
jgi:flagellar basal-body rod modification protein FlgD